jgi:hypothetical protein
MAISSTPSFFLCPHLWFSPSNTKRSSLPQPTAASYPILSIQNS